MYLGKVSNVGVWGNERGLHTLRCDDGVWLAFKHATKALGSSICSTAEGLMLGVIGAYETMQQNNVHMGNTFNIDMKVFRQLGREHRKANPEYFANVDEEEFLKKYKFEIDSYVKFFNDMGESPSRTKIVGKLAESYALPPSATVEDRIKLGDIIHKRLNTGLGK